MSFKIIKCWLTRHHWLFQGEQPTKLYAENELVAESYAYYECLVCGSLKRVNMMNLDNLPPQVS